MCRNERGAFYGIIARALLVRWEHIVKQHTSASSSSTEPSSSPTSLPPPATAANVATWKELETAMFRAYAHAPLLTVADGTATSDAEEKDARQKRDFLEKVFAFVLATKPKE